MLRFLTSRQHVLRLWFHAFNLLYVTSAQKQVTDVSLVLKDSDLDSVNLSLLIQLSVSDGQKTDSPKVVSVIGILYKYYIPYAGDSRKYHPEESDYQPRRSRGL